MKKFITLSIVLIAFSLNSLFAQDMTTRKPERNVPIAVAEAFKSKYSQSDPVWFSQYQGRYNDQLVYEARFIFDNRYSSAIYDRAGIMIAFAATIEASEIPAKAIIYMKNNYTDRGVTEAMLVTRREKETSIELGIYINNRFTIVVFDKEGNFIKTTLG
jgi:hypothetical protein